MFALCVNELATIFARPAGAIYARAAIRRTVDRSRTPRKSPDRLARRPRM